MTDREKILDKLRKLQAHADSAEEIGNEAEAQAFAAKIQELLTAYKISMSEVRVEGVEEEPINKTDVYWGTLGMAKHRKPSAWAEMLARIVAKAYYCDFVAVRAPKGCRGDTGGWIGFFVGTDTDRKITIQMYVILSRFIQSEATKAYNEFWKQLVRQGEPVQLARGFRKGWIEGFLMRLAERFEEEVRPKATVPASNTSAIVLVRRNALARIKEWIDKDKGISNDCRSPQMADGSEYGIEAGRQAADRINLRQKAVEGTRTEARRIR